MENSKIGWTDHTLNFWTGCKKVSEGCKYCYMYRDKERYKQDPKTVIKASKQTINKVLRTAKAGDKIFTCSWSDFFIEEADFWRDEAWAIIRANPQFIWQILTKRPERIKECLPSDWGEKGWKQVWLGTTCENQEMFDKRYPLIEPFFSGQDDDACKNFISFEPLLGAINLDKYYHSYKTEFGTEVDCDLALDWAIIGGESGNENGAYLYRPCEEQWIDDLIVRLTGDIPVFLKQLGTYIAKKRKLKSRHGTDHSEFPRWFQVKEFPNDKY